MPPPVGLDPAAAFAGLSDIDLMLGLKDGEAHFLGPLLARHRQSVVHFLYRMVQNAAIAEELSQEVFLSVYRARSRYEPSADFTCWLYRIATNRAINWFRDNRYQRHRTSLDDVIETRAAPIATPEDALLRREFVHRVRSAVRALPERQRAAVLLHKYGDLEHAEIAQVLGCSLSATKSLLHRAYLALRQSLATP